MSERNILLTLLILAVTAGVALIYWLWSNGEELPVLDRTKPFILEEVSGGDYNSNNGKVKLLTFYYTKCPDICPLTMMDFNRLQARLLEKGLFGEEVELLAITLDPESDTNDVVKNYAHQFDADGEGWKFLRGSASLTNEIAQEYHMKYRKLEGDFIAHNTTMFLIDRENNIRELYNMANSQQGIDKEDILRSILLLVNE